MSIEEIVEQGLLEQYVLGGLSAERALLVREAMANSPSLSQRLAELELAMERLAEAGSKEPSAHVRTELLQAVSHEAAERRDPPILHPGSRAQDFALWIDRPDMVEAPDNENIFFLPFAQTAQAVTALVWMRNGAEEETHTDCIEKFLILDGSCEISMKGQVHPLKAGDHMSIPLFTPHTVKVTSAMPCRILLQRVAA